MVNDMPDVEQQQDNTISRTFRLPADIMAWLDELADADRRTTNGLLVAMLRDMREKCSWQTSGIAKDGK